MMDADDMKAILCCYWRFVRACPYVATECGFGSLCDSAIDVVAVNKNLYVLETEIKVSISDLRQEIKKAKYRHSWGVDGLTPRYQFPAKYTTSKYFYFAVPEDIAAKAHEIIHQLYPGAGLLVVREPVEGKFDTYRSIDVTVAINPKQQPMAKQITIQRANTLLLRIVNQMCASMVDAANARRAARGTQIRMAQ